MQEKTHDKRTNSERQRDRDFMKIRNQWVRMLVEDLDISHPTCRVGMNLVLRMTGKNPTAWPSIKTISKATGVSVSSVIRAIGQLQEANYLHVKRRRNAGNVYAFRFP